MIRNNSIFKKFLIWRGKLSSEHIHSPTARTEGLNKIEEDYVSPEIF